MMNDRDTGGGGSSFQQQPVYTTTTTNTTNTMNNPNANSNPGLDDLQFMTSVDNSIPQNVPNPSIISPSMIQPSPHNNMQTNNTPDVDNNNGGVLSQVFQNSAHPIPCIFHCAFKSAALTLYLFGGFFTGSHNERFIVITVSCIILLAMDFWTVKNVTGRLLVGLRWWNQVVGEDLTETKWIFESSEQYKPNSFDKSVFWTVLYITPLIWIFLFFMGLLKMEFGWLITVSFAIALTASNTYGYWHCSKDQRAKFEQMMARGAGLGAVSAVRGVAVGAMGTLAEKFAGLATAGTNGSGSGNVNANGGGGYGNANTYT